MHEWVGSVARTLQQQKTRYLQHMMEFCERAHTHNNHRTAGVRRVSRYHGCGAPALTLTASRTTSIAAGPCFKYIHSAHKNRLDRSATTSHHVVKSPHFWHNRALDSRYPGSLRQHGGGETNTTNTGVNGYGHNGTHHISHNGPM